MDSVPFPISAALSSAATHLGRLLDWPARLYPERIALATETESVTYRGLCARIEARRLELAELGADRGMRWGLAYPNGVDFIVDLFALWQLECVASPLRGSWPPARREQAAREAKLDGVLCSGAVAGPKERREARPRRLGGPTDLDPALILWTSGSSGRPRGAVLQHHAVLANIVANIKSLGAHDDDVALVVLPLSHSYSLIHQALCHLAVGGTLVFPNQPLVSTELVRTIERHSVSTIALVPPLLPLLTDGLRRTRLECRTLRLITVGAARARAEDVNAVRELVPHALIALTYGLTEAGPRVATRFLESEAGDMDRVGTPLPNVAVTDWDGVLRVHSRSQMLGYVDVLDQPQTGLATNDLGSIDDGVVTLQGRAGRAINRGGVMISPEEIEQALCRHPRVSRCRVVAVAHPTYGEAPEAIVCGTDVTSEELMRWCIEIMPAEERPIRITICDQIDEVEKLRELTSCFQEERLK